jgi:flagellar motor switch protein FliN
MDAGLEVTLRFGQRQMSLAKLAALGPGAVVELDQKVEEPIELILGGRVLARGEVMIVDGNYGLRVTELFERNPS